MDWKSLLLKPAVPYVLAALALGGWFTHYTMQQRAIGAMQADLRASHAVIDAAQRGASVDSVRAAALSRSVDSLERQLIGLRSRAQHSDSLATALTLSYRAFRDQVLAAPPGSVVPTLSQMFAQADTAVNACELARADCKARADREEQRGDSARAESVLNASRANRLSVALDSSRSNERKLKRALPSTAGNVVRASKWAVLGGVAAWAGCRLGFLRCG
jgi:hypothetical protein